MEKYIKSFFLFLLFFNMVFSKAVLADEYAPEIERVAPSSSSYSTAINNTINFKINATAGRGLKRVDWYLDGSLKSSNNFSSDVYYKEGVQWSQSFSSSGSYNIGAVVVDDLNQTAELAWSVSITNSAPSVSKKSPTSTNQSILEKDSITLSIDVSDSDSNLDGIEWFIGSSNVKYSSANGSSASSSYTFNSSSPGNKTIYAYAYDQEGKESFTYWEIDINANSAPEASRNSYTSGSVEVEQDLSLSFSTKGSDIDGNIKAIEWFVKSPAGNTESVEYSNESGSSATDSFTYTFNQVGQYTIYGYVYDEFDEESFVYWLVDVIEPTYDLIIDVSNVTGGNQNLSGDWRVNIYDANYSFLKSKTETDPSVLISQLSAGNYIFEVYFTANDGLNTTEYWGSESIVIDQGKSVAFTRKLPYVALFETASNRGDKQYIAGEDVNAKATIEPNVLGGGNTVDGYDHIKLRFKLDGQSWVEGGETYISPNAFDAFAKSIAPNEVGSYLPYYELLFENGGNWVVIDHGFAETQAVEVSEQLKTATNISVLDIQKVIGKEVLFSASLSNYENGQFIEGKTLNFEYPGGSCSAITNADGLASCSGMPSGSGQFTVSFGGDSEYAAFNSSAQVSIYGYLKKIKLSNLEQFQVPISEDINLPIPLEDFYAIPQGDYELNASKMAMLYAASSSYTRLQTYEFNSVVPEIDNFITLADSVYIDAVEELKSQGTTNIAIASGITVAATVGGAAIGAAACVWSGPGAVLCGAAGAKVGAVIGSAIGIFVTAADTAVDAVGPLNDIQYKSLLVNLHIDEAKLNILGAESLLEQINSANEIDYGLLAIAGTQLTTGRSQLLESARILERDFGTPSSSDYLTATLIVANEAAYDDFIPFEKISNKLLYVPVIESIDLLYSLFRNSRDNQIYSDDEWQEIIASHQASFDVAMNQIYASGLFGKDTISELERIFISLGYDEFVAREKNVVLSLNQEQTENCKVKFNYEKFGFGDEEIVNLRFDFGDGQSKVFDITSPETVPTSMHHDYSKTGTYNSEIHITLNSQKVLTSNLSVDVSGMCQPSINEFNVTKITQSSVEIETSTISNGNDYQVSIKYGLDGQYSLESEPSYIPSTETETLLVNQINDLQCDTLYQYQIKLESPTEVIYSEDFSEGNPFKFRTDSCPATEAPALTTKNATEISQNNAVLNTSVDSNGSNTSVYFEYGASTSYGLTTTPLSVGSESYAISTNQYIDGLSCATTYQFRAVAENAIGVSYGDNFSFETLACDAVDNDPSAPILSDGFEGQNIGTPQAPWLFNESWGDSGTIQVVDGSTISGTKSIKVEGESGLAQGIYLENSYQPNQIVKIDFDVYLPSGNDEGQAPTYFIYGGAKVTFYMGSDGLYQARMQHDENNMLEGISPDTWHSLSLVVDSINKTAKVLWNGASTELQDISDSTIDEVNGGFGTDISLYGNNSANVNTGYYDNIRLGVLKNIETGLIAHYEFEDNANDSSGNGNHGVEFSPLNYSQGHIGQAAEFNGQSDGIDTGISYKNDTMAVSMWVKPEEKNDYLVLLDSYIAPRSNKAGFRLYIMGAETGDPLEFGRFNGDSGGEHVLRINSNLGNEWNWDRWFHLYADYDSDTGQARLYVNSKLVAEGTDATQVIDTYTLKIGATENSGDNGMKGQIDDVRIYSRRLSKSEIEELYEMDSNLNSSLVAYYEFDGNGKDLSGNSHNSTVVGEFDYLNGVLNRAAKFDGSNYMVIDGQGINKNVSSSVLAWVKYDANGRYNFIDFFNSSLSTDVGFELGLEGGDVYFYYRGLKNESAVVDNVSSSKKLDDGIWHLLTGVYSESEQVLKLYIDSELEASKSFEIDSVGNPNQKLVIGASSEDDQTNYRFNGLMDGVRLYEKALSSTEIQEIYANGVTINKGLAAHFEFEGNTNDSSGNGNNGSTLGSVVYSDGSIGQAISFDGNNSTDVGNFSYSDGTTLNVSFWVKGLGQKEAIVSQYDYENSELAWQIVGRANGEIAIYVGSEGANSSHKIADTDKSYLDDSWHHVSFNWSNSEISLYIDGEKSKLNYVQNPSFSIIGNLTSNIKIAGETNSNEGTWTGQVDDLRIYAEALSDKAIRELYAMGADLNNGLVAHYEFEGNAEDSSGNGNNGTENGGITYSSGVIGQAASFDGVDDYIQTNTFTDSWNNWAVSLFVQMNNLSSKQNILEREILGHYNDLQMFYEGESVAIQNDLASIETAYSENASDWNQWHHIVVQYDGSVRKMFIDGKLSVSEAVSDAEVTVEAPLLIGRHTNNETSLYLDGKLDDLKVYDRALTDQEISQLSAALPEFNDTENPQILIAGDNPTTVALDSTYIDEGATASDNIDGDLTAQINITSNVDTSQLGTYSVAYSVSDTSSNSTTAFRTVHVTDQTRPEIRLVGLEQVDIDEGQTYIDDGATASDNVDGDLTASIVVVNKVNTSVPGEYSVTFDVSDSAENQALTVSRKVRVNAIPDSEKDTDGDGMDDAFEKNNSLDYLLKDSHLDADNDGFSNLEEYQFGTVANDAASFPRSNMLKLIAPVLRNRN